MSGTAFGTVDRSSRMPDLWPWPGVGSGLRVPSNGTCVTSKSGPRSSSEPVRNGKPIIGVVRHVAALGVLAAEADARPAQVELRGSRQGGPARRQARTIAAASTRPT